MTSRKEEGGGKAFCDNRAKVGMHSGLFLSILCNFRYSNMFLMKYFIFVGTYSKCKLSCGLIGICLFQTNIILIKNYP